MKNILLISNYVHHYRARIYNRFYEEFKKHGYEFHVLSNSYQEVDFDISFIKHEVPFGVFRYIRKIKEIHPAAIINFLHIKDNLIFQLTFFSRMHNIPMIYWGHGINHQYPNHPIKNIFFRLIHTISSAIILYSPDQLKHISRKNQQKTFIALNTLDFSAVKKENIRSREAVKKQYGIKEDFVVLFISRIQPRKGLDILLNNLKDQPSIALVVVGGGISKKQLLIIENHAHFYYLGEKYGQQADEIFNMGDVFSTPGHIGLALNQAFYWGKPVILLNKIHAPEIYFMKEGQTGFIVDNEYELKEKFIELSVNKNLLLQLSQNAERTGHNEMTIENMFSGFIDAIHFCEKAKNKQLYN